MHMASCSVIKFYSPVTCGSVYLLSRTGRACAPTTANATTCNRDSQQLKAVSINSRTDIHSDDDICWTCTAISPAAHTGHRPPTHPANEDQSPHSPSQRGPFSPLTQPMRTSLPTHPANEDQPPHSPSQRGPVSPLTQPTRTILPTHPANEDQSPHSPSQRGPVSPLTQPTRTNLPTHPANEDHPSCYCWCTGHDLDRVLIVTQL